MHLLLDTTEKNNFICKRHMQFLTSAPNFRGVNWPPDPPLPSSC